MQQNPSIKYMPGWTMVCQELWELLIRIKSAGHNNKPTDQSPKSNSAFTLCRRSKRIWQRFIGWTVWGHNWNIVSTMFDVGDDGVMTTGVETEKEMTPLQWGDCNAVSGPVKRKKLVFYGEVGKHCWWQHDDRGRLKLVLSCTEPFSTPQHYYY